MKRIRVLATAVWFSLRGVLDLPSATHRSAGLPRPEHRLSRRLLRRLLPWPCCARLSIAVRHHCSRPDQRASNLVLSHRPDRRVENPGRSGDHERRAHDQLAPAEEHGPRVCRHECPTHPVNVETRKRREKQYKQFCKPGMDGAGIRCGDSDWDVPGPLRRVDGRRRVI